MPEEQQSPRGLQHLARDDEVWGCIMRCTESSLAFGGQSKLPRTSSRTSCCPLLRRWVLLCAATTAPLPCTSIAGKAYANVLRARLSQWLIDNLLDEQCGFRPSRSTVDALFSLHRLCNGAWDKGQTLHICMLDLTKAFDSLDREMAWQILLSKGAPPKLVALIRDLHTHHSVVIHSEVDSAPVGTSVGFKQGCVLAPPLFNVCLDSVICQLLPQLQQLDVTICYEIDGQLMHCKKPTKEVLM